jgi:hypothetical protein
MTQRNSMYSWGWALRCETDKWDIQNSFYLLTLLHPKMKNIKPNRNFFLSISKLRFILQMQINYYDWKNRSADDSIPLRSQNLIVVHYRGLSRNCTSGGAEKLIWYYVVDWRLWTVDMGALVSWRAGRWGRHLFGLKLMGNAETKVQRAN